MELKDINISKISLYTSILVIDVSLSLLLLSIFSNYFFYFQEYHNLILITLIYLYIYTIFIPNELDFEILYKHHSVIIYFISIYSSSCYNSW